MTMQPEGEDLRRAVKWISDERQHGEETSLPRLIEKAGVKFDLSPMEEEYLTRFFAKDRV